MNEKILSILLFSTHSSMFVFCSAFLLQQISQDPGHLAKLISNTFPVGSTNQILTAIKRESFNGTEQEGRGGEGRGKNEQGLGEMDVNVHTSINSTYVHAITAKRKLADTHMHTEPVLYDPERVG